MSTVSIQRCEPEDMPACMEVVSVTFKHEAPFVDIFFPGHETSSGRAHGAERFLKQLQTDKDAVFLKATQTEESGEKIVGFAIWTHMVKPPSSDLSTVEDMAAVWPDSSDREFASGIWRDYVGPRSTAVEQAEVGKGAMVLELMAVHPDAQSRKVGTNLLQWGTDLADKKGIEAAVEAVPNALKFYEKGGFITTIERMPFEVEERFKQRKTPVISFMRKQPKSNV